MKEVPFEKHILLCGWVKNPLPILEQLFAEDLQNHRPVVVVGLDVEVPPMEHEQLAVVSGDPTNSETLQRANVENAHSAIILADREEPDTNAADARSILIALAIKSLQPHVFTCAEVLNPTNTVHFRNADVDEEISAAQFGNCLTIQSTLSPGLSRILVDMLTFGDGEEMYRLPVPPAFVGRRFADLGATLLYQQSMVLIGVASEDGKRIENSYRAKYVLQEEDYIFVLAEDEPTGLETLKFKVPG